MAAAQVVKHTAVLAQLVVGAGGVGALVDYCRESSGNNRLPATMALGYVAAFSETLALSVIAGVPAGGGLVCKPHAAARGRACSHFVLWHGLAQRLMPPAVRGKRLPAGCRVPRTHFRLHSSPPRSSL